jgi:hypothetical protein
LELLLFIISICSSCASTYYLGRNRCNTYGHSMIANVHIRTMTSHHFSHVWALLVCLILCWQKSLGCCCCFIGGKCYNGFSILDIDVSFHVLHVDGFGILVIWTNRGRVCLLQVASLPRLEVCPGVLVRQSTLEGLHFWFNHSGSNDGN